MEKGVKGEDYRLRVLNVFNQKYMLRFLIYDLQLETMQIII